MGNMIVLNVSMGLVYAFSTQHSYWYVVIPAAFFHVFTVGFMVVLAKVNPGFISRVYPVYEKEELQHVPIRQECVTGSISFR